MPQVLPDVPGDGSGFDIAEFDRLGFFSALDAARDGIAVGRGMLAELVAVESEGFLRFADQRTAEALTTDFEAGVERLIAEPGSRQAVLGLRAVEGDMHGFTCELRCRVGRPGALTRGVARNWARGQRRVLLGVTNRRVALLPPRHSSRARQSRSRRRVARSSRSPDDSGPSSEPPGLAAREARRLPLHPRARRRS